MFKLDNGMLGAVKLFPKGVTYVKIAIVIMAPSKTSMNMISISMSSGQ
jgi:hypothetical protein